MRENRNITQRRRRRKPPSPAEPERQEPEKRSVMIFSPSDDSRFEAGEAITLEGWGFGSQGQILSGEALCWSSDRDGELGTGQSLLVSGLSPGAHTITLTALEDGREWAHNRIEIFIARG